MQTIDIDKQLKKYQIRIKKQSYYASIIKQLLESNNIQAWYLLQKSIAIMQKQNQRELYRFFEKLYIYMDYIVTIPMFFYIYSLKQDKKMYLINWQKIYEKLRIDNQILMFNSWISQQYNQQLCQKTLEMIIKAGLIFMKTQLVYLTQNQLTSILYWINFFKTRTSKTYQLVCQLAKFCRDKRIIPSQDIMQKEHLIVKKTIQVMVMFNYTQGNNFLLMNYNVMQKDITYLCHVMHEYILDLNQEQICKVFQGLLKATITKQVLWIIDQFSRLYCQNEQFYKLRIIYQKIILPILARKIKNHPKNQELIYKICRFYIIGFLNYCVLGEDGLICITKNIHLMKSVRLRDSWVQLCIIIVNKYSQLRQPMIKLLTSEKITKQQIEAIKISQKVFEQLFNVTQRTGNKHKIYPKSPSTQYKGITNQGNQCYIITVIQGLYLTNQLKLLLDNQEYKRLFMKELSLLNEIRKIFQQLSNNSYKSKSVYYSPLSLMNNKEIKVSYLQRQGPQLYSQSFSQQDSQLYLLTLFQSIEQSLQKYPKLKQSFENIFKIHKKLQIICPCGHKVQKNQYEYIFTISHKQVLKQQYEQEVSGYHCQKCQKLNEIKTIRTIHPKCKILIVHINRFQHKGGVAKKLLYNQRILRNFMNYTLVGMICHIGRNVSHGHYIYYGKVSKYKWIELNDKSASQFTLEKQDEEFQMEMKAQMTPYILFYKMKQK